MNGVQEVVQLIGATFNELEVISSNSLPFLWGHVKKKKKKKKEFKKKLKKKRKKKKKRKGDTNN
jgi:hypothetical protein